MPVGTAGGSGPSTEAQRWSPLLPALLKSRPCLHRTLPAPSRTCRDPECPRPLPISWVQAGSAKSPKTCTGPTGPLIRSISICQRHPGGRRLWLSPPQSPFGGSIIQKAFLVASRASPRQAATVSNSQAGPEPTPGSLPRCQGLTSGQLGNPNPELAAGNLLPPGLLGPTLALAPQGASGCRSQWVLLPGSEVPVLDGSWGVALGEALL